MKRPKRGGERPLRKLTLPRGVVLYGRALDAYALTRIDAAVEADLAALVRGDGEPAYDWALDADYCAALAANPGLRAEFSAWMKLVVLATHAISRVEGFDADEEGPVEPSFDLFAALFEEPLFEEAFKHSSVLLMFWQEAEKKGSGAAPNGDLAAAPNTAQVAGPATIPSSGTPAPEASPSKILTASGDVAPISNTPPTAMPAPSPGNSPAAPAAGASALAASPASIGTP